MSETRHKWTDQQKKFIAFVGRGKRDKFGNSHTMEEFAKVVGVHRDTLYEWRRLGGFAQAVFEEALLNNVEYLPEILKAQAAAGLKKGKGGETAAFMALMRQYELLKSDKIDHTTNGKDLPAPILGGVTNENTPKT